MATDNNYDLIEGTTTQSSCACGETDFVEFFMSKTSATTFTDTITSENGFSVWDTSAIDGATLTLGIGGSSGTTGESKILVQGVNNNDATIQVKGTNTLTLKPNGISALQYESGSTSNPDHFRATSSSLHSGGDSVFNGDITPYADSTFDLGADATRWANIYSDDLNATNATIGTLTLSSLSLTSLSLSGSLTVDSDDDGDAASFNGPVNLGSADNDGDAIIVKGNLTTQGTVTLGSSGKTLTIGQSGGTSELGVALDANNKNITGIADVSASTGHISTTPSAANDIVRYQDVNIGGSASFVLPQITVDSGFITAITEGTVANLLDHAVKHKTTSKTTASSSGTGAGDDPLHSYEIGAVERTHPVVGRPLKIIPTTSSNYDYSSSTPKDYFVVIGKDQSLPDSANAIEGQFAFRKRDS